VLVPGTCVPARKHPEGAVRINLFAEGTSLLATGGSKDYNPPLKFFESLPFRRETESSSAFCPLPSSIG
jgi:hypothetical protein